jgi:zinc/manganese transport system substrate-binding protein
MTMRILIPFVLFVAGLSAQGAWALNVVATTTSMGMLAREVGGAAVRVSELASPARDIHTLEAKPSMMRALRDADLLVAVGAELEIGWLPAAINGAANPALLPGRPGYFEAAAQVPLLEAGVEADRAHGDVHPAGNPHVNLDPERMGRIAAALAERLARLDAAGAADYRERAARFAAAARERVAQWRQRAAGSPGAVLYHKDGDYLLHWLNLPVLGYLEPVAGVPPTARHLESLVGKLKGRRGIVLRQPYQPAAGAEKLAAALGWRTAVVALDPPHGATADAYFTLIESWVNALAAARP